MEKPNGTENVLRGLSREEWRARRLRDLADALEAAFLAARE
jgi:hypothetical protein